MGKAENYVEHYLRDRVKKLRGLCFKFTSGVNGVPDRVVILDGQVVWVEAKAPGKKPDPLQLVRHAEMRTAGADVRVIDTREQVDELIRELTSPAGPPGPPGGPDLQP